MILTEVEPESRVAWKTVHREEQFGGIWASQLRTGASGVRAISGQLEGWKRFGKSFLNVSEHF